MVEFRCGHGYNSRTRGLFRRQATADATRKWPEGFAFRWQLNGVIRGLDQATMEAGITKALEKWGKLSNFTYAQDTSSPNVKISVITRDGEEPNFSNEFTLGYSGVGPSGSDDQLNGYVRLNDTTTAGTRWNPKLLHDMFLHEFGHVLGLGHAYDENAVMAAAVRPMGSTERELTNIDITKFQTFYSGYSSPGQYPSTNQPTNQYPETKPTPSDQYPANPTDNNNGYPTMPTSNGNNNGYPTTPSYENNEGQAQNPPSTTGNRQVCDDAHARCLQGQTTLRRRKRRGIDKLKRQTNDYGDPCRAEWEKCMQQQQLVK
ncbi:hypothetical protein ABW20_dc0100861 [Dactylellina cionopaga]|nr:hypothetical protein ABW20_dc0100861 [Dactylellina cionopaga]